MIHRYILASVVLGASLTINTKSRVEDLSLAPPQEEPPAATATATTATATTATTSMGIEAWLEEWAREARVERAEEARETAVEENWEIQPTTEKKDEVEEDEETREDPNNTTEGLFEGLEDLNEKRWEQIGGVTPVGTTTTLEVMPATTAISSGN